jgi:hypothetical protein
MGRSARRTRDWPGIGGSSAERQHGETPLLTLGTGPFLVRASLTIVKASCAQSVRSPRAGSGVFKVIIWATDESRGLSLRRRRFGNHGRRIACGWRCCAGYRLSTLM